jgi:hypothetical protein
MNRVMIVEYSLPAMLPGAWAARFASRIDSLKTRGRDARVTAVTV